MAVATDWRQAPLSAADRAMLAYSEKLTLTPAAMTAADVDGLRAQGFSDREIVSIALAAAYRNYITRVADGLGAELRRTMDYTPEFIRAFGVDPEQARTTLYADRTTTATAVGSVGWQPTPAATDDGSGAPRAAWVSTTPARGDAERFAALRAEWAALTAPLPWDHLALALATRPDAFEQTMRYARLVDHTGSCLERWQEALIGAVVGAALGVRYTTCHHQQALLQAPPPGVRPLDLIRDLAAGADPPAGDVSVLVQFCRKLAHTPGTMSAEDVEALRGSGLDDRAIVTVVGAAAFQAFLCGLAAGLGVSLESGPWDSRLLEQVPAAWRPAAHH